MRVAFVRRIECVANFLGSRPTLATHRSTGARTAASSEIDLASTWKQNLPQLPTAAAQIRLERLARRHRLWEPSRGPALKYPGHFVAANGGGNRIVRTTPLQLAACSCDALQAPYRTGLPTIVVWPAKQRGDLAPESQAFAPSFRYHFIPRREAAALRAARRPMRRVGWSFFLQSGKT
jgi:hypothetical protein